MDLIPTEKDILQLFRETGALREGHFAYSNGVHTDQHVDPAVAMRFYQNAKLLSVALSRQLRANRELATLLPQLSIVAATPSGLPIAYGLGEVLHPKQVYWVETNSTVRTNNFLSPHEGEKVLLVDDILRSGKLLAQAKALFELHGAVVVGIAVVVHQPTLKTIDLSPVPLYCLARLHPRSYVGHDSCDLCQRGVALNDMGADWKSEEAFEAAAMHAS